MLLNVFNAQDSAYHKELSGPKRLQCETEKLLDPILRSVFLHVLNLESASLRVEMKFRYILSSHLLILPSPNVTHRHSIPRGALHSLIHTFRLTPMCPCLCCPSALYPGQEKGCLGICASLNAEIPWFAVMIQ